MIDEQRTAEDIAQDILSESLGAGPHPSGLHSAIADAITQEREMLAHERENVERLLRAGVARDKKAAEVEAALARALRDVYLSPGGYMVEYFKERKAAGDALANVGPEVQRLLEGGNG